MRILTAWAAFALIISDANGQGLLSIGQHLETEGSKPWTMTIHSLVGWDSNPLAGQGSVTTGAAGTANASTSSQSNQGAAYLQNDVNLTYAMTDRINHLQLAGDYSNLWYPDRTLGAREDSNNWRISGSYFRQDSPLLTVSDSFYLSHQTQPDFSVGIGLNRPTSGSLIGYNGLQVMYSLSRVLSTVTGYNITGTSYDDPALRTENFVDHLFSEEIRYIASRRSTLTGSLRYEITQYPENHDANSKTLFLLAGIDHKFNPRWQGGVTAGAEFRQYDGPLKSYTAPYVESSMSYSAGKNTTWRWYANLGLNDTGQSGTQSGYSYRTGLTYSHQFTPRLSCNVSANFEWTNYRQNSSSPSPVSPTGLAETNVSIPGDNQETVSASVNFNYLLWRNVSLTAGYSYTDITGSTSTVGAYERQQVTAGMSANF